VVLVLIAVAVAGAPAMARTHGAARVGHAPTLRFGMRVPGMMRVPNVVNAKARALSLNWSGWAAESKQGAFNYVHARFRQAAVHCDGRPNNYTSQWTGLDGFTSNTVEQTGTAASCQGRNHRRPEYHAWYELFPAPEVAVFPVRPGDLIDSLVWYGNGKFHLRIADITRHRSASISAACSQCLRSSAEWITERPALCNNGGTNCFITAPANFGTDRFMDASAGIDGGQARPISYFAHQAIDMVQPKKNGKLILLAHTSGLHRNDHSSSSFSVKWLARGGILPLS
jgi:hypothetical protein